QNRQPPQPESPATVIPRCRKTPPPPHTAATVRASATFFGARATSLRVPSRRFRLRPPKSCAAAKEARLSLPERAVTPPACDPAPPRIPAASPWLWRLYSTLDFSISIPAHSPGGVRAPLHRLKGYSCTQWNPRLTSNILLRSSSFVRR